MRMPIELRLLRSALALAEHKNFARGAQALEVSQPTLSRNIQEIEQQIGTRLFERGTNGVVPTDAGRIFLEQAREVVARSSDLDREMDLLRGLEKGDLRIGAGTYPCSMFVDRAVVRLLRAHPTIRLELHTDNREKLLSALRRRELDLAAIAVTDIEIESELQITRLNRHQGHFVVRSGHPLLGSKQVPTVGEILRFPVAMTSRFPVSLLKQFLADDQKNSPHSDVKSFPAIACESVAVMKMIVEQTDTVTILPVNVVSEEVHTGKLVVLSLAPPALNVDFGIVRLAHRSLSPIAETFVRMIQEVDEELSRFEQKHTAEIVGKRAHGAGPKTKPLISGSLRLARRASN